MLRQNQPCGILKFSSVFLFHDLEGHQAKKNNNQDPKWNLLNELIILNCWNNTGCDHTLRISNWRKADSATIVDHGCAAGTALHLQLVTQGHVLTILFFKKDKRQKTSENHVAEKRKTTASKTRHLQLSDSETINWAIKPN